MYLPQPIRLRTHNEALAWAGLAVLVLSSGCRQPATDPAGALLAAYDSSADCRPLTITHPLDGTVFPPELAPPVFRWAESEPICDRWLISFRFADAGPREDLLVAGRDAGRDWTPPADRWAEIKRRSREQDATALILGFQADKPSRVLVAGRVAFRTSADKVGAPLFYREVNLPFIEAVKDPTKIRWRFGPISSTEPPPIVLEGLPVCGNCHSFSADGALLGMDVDYANDKGSYALAAVESDMVLADDNIITWSDFRREDGQTTFGLLSQVSPDGRYAVSTVKDRSIFVPKPDLAFSQLFFPIQGVLAVYDRRTQAYRTLPGADDPQYVQSNPSWSPDGEYIVFARSEVYHLAHDTGHALLTQEQCADFLEVGKPFRFDLYRVPFNGGEGGTPEPLVGASNNGRSNFFARYSPDGRWIVFCQADNYMLLQPDSELFIIPAEGGEARRLACNTGRMNSWHSWSPNGRWLVFASKADSDYTQLYLAHIDEAGRSSPPVLLAQMTAADRAANIPEFVSAAPTAIAAIHARFVDDLSFVRAGDAFLRADDDAEGAIAQYRKAIAINPDNAIAHSNLGGLLVHTEAVEEGVAHLLEAIRLDPTNGSPYYNLGALRYRQGQIDEAIENLTLAVKYRPDEADARRVLGACLCTRGRVADGIEQLSEAVQLDPTSAVAHYCLGKALASVGMLSQARGHLSRAVELESGYVPALRLLGELVYQDGDHAAAIEHLARAAEAQPDDPRLLGQLAWLLSAEPDPAVRDAARAVEYAERACALTDRKVLELLDVLGSSYAAAGRFEEAVQAAREALALAESAGQPDVAARIAERIRLYEQGRPFDPPPTGPAPPGP